MGGLLLPDVIPPAVEGLDVTTNPGTMAEGFAPVHRNLLVHREGLLPMRGPIHDEANLILDSDEMIGGAWVFDDKVLFSHVTKSATATREPHVAPYRKAAASTDLATAELTMRLVDLAAGTAVNVVAANQDGVVSGRGARLGPYVYGFAYAANAAAVNEQGGFLERRPLLRWDGTSTTPTVYTNAPQGGQDVIPHLNRLWLLGGRDVPSGAPGLIEFNSLYFSDLFGPETDAVTEWQETTNTNKFIVDSDNPNDFGVGLALQDQSLMVFKRRSIHILYGYSPTTFQLRPLTYELGCVDRRSIVQHGGVVYWMSDQGLHSYDGQSISSHDLHAAVETGLLTALSQTVGDEGSDGGRVVGTGLPNEYTLYSICTQAFATGVQADDSSRFCVLFHTPTGRFTEFRTDVLRTPSPVDLGRTTNKVYVTDGTQVADASGITVPESSPEAERGFDHVGSTTPARENLNKNPKLESAYKASVIALQPSLYWVLDNVDGATDQSGNGRNGTAVGGVTVGAAVDSPIGGETRSTEFDGGNDQITSTYNPYTAATARTFCGWAKGDAGGGDSIIAVSTGASFTGPWVAADGTTFNHYLNGFTETDSFPAAWTHGVWHHWAVTVDQPSNEVKLYMDGDLFATNTLTNDYSGVTGNFQLGFSSNSWDGKQAQVAVFERELTDTEIAALANPNEGEAGYATIRPAEPKAPESASSPPEDLLIEDLLDGMSAGEDLADRAAPVGGPWTDDSHTGNSFEAPAVPDGTVRLTNRAGTETDSEVVWIDPDGDDSTKSVVRAGVRITGLDSFTNGEVRVGLVTRHGNATNYLRAYYYVESDYGVPDADDVHEQGWRVEKVVAGTPTVLYDENLSSSGVSFLAKTAELEVIDDDWRLIVSDAEKAAGSDSDLTGALAVGAYGVYGSIVPSEASTAGEFEVTVNDVRAWDAERPHRVDLTDDGTTDNTANGITATKGIKFAGSASASRPYRVTSAQPYTASVYVRAKTAAVTAELDASDVSGNPADKVSQLITTADGWVRLSKTVVADATASRNIVVRNLSAIDTLGYLYATQHLTETGSTLYPYIEGSVGSSAGADARIPAAWHTRLLKCAHPRDLVQLHRLFLDYAFIVDGADDDEVDGWFVRVVGGDGRELLAEFQVPGQGDPGGYLYRRSLVRDLFGETNDLQVRIEWRDDGSQTYPALVRAELYDVGLEYQDTRQRRSS